MPRESPIKSANSGSYVQLSTFDDKEKAFVQPKSTLPPVWPYKRCLCTKRDAILVGIVLVGALVIITVSLSLGLPRIAVNRARYLNTSFPVSPSPLLTFSKAVVATDAAGCAAIGKQVLEKNGSAVDATIATLFCNGVMNPQSMGIGGGFLMTVYSKSDQKSFVIDAREVAPQKASKDMFDGNSSLALEGGLSIAVPGELRGYQLAHERFGKLPWKELVMPSVQLCKEGISVSEHLALNLEKLRDKILKDESLRSEFFNNETNDLYKAGEILQRPRLGNTLLKIANEGAEVIYSGSLQKSLLDDIAVCGGIITDSDLSDYKPLLKPAVKVTLTGPKPLVLHTVSTPGSGPVLALVLNTLGYYNMSADDFKDTDRSVLMYHRIIEAFKFGFAHRTKLGDEAFVNITQILNEMQDPLYAKSIMEEISDMKTFPLPAYKAEMDVKEDHGTAHVSVIAENGDAVSVTSTVNTYFGSLCLSPQTGILLNNAMDDFSSPNITNYFGLPPSPANYVAPGKRPLSSMCPALLLDPQQQEVRLAVGGAGGTRLITASAMGVIRSLWLSQDIKQVTDAPRIHHQLQPNYIQHEKEFPKIFLDKLKSFGHDSKLESQASVFVGIVRGDDNSLSTNVDHRKAGSADGY